MPSLNKAIDAKGWDAIPESEREGVSRPAPPSPAYRDYLFDVYRQHAGIGAAKEAVSQPQPTDRAFGFEGQAAGQAFVENDADRVLVRGRSGLVRRLHLLG